MLLQPITVPFSKSTLKPSVYTLNRENLMQTFENLLLQNYSTKFLDITYK